jgi:hypothetical protein
MDCTLAVCLHSTGDPGGGPVAQCAYPTAIAGLKTGSQKGIRVTALLWMALRRAFAIRSQPELS